VTQQRADLTSAWRTFVHDYERWTAREGDGRAVPGSRGPVYLIFENGEAVRRYWIFPANWWQMDDSELWRFGETFPASAVARVTESQTMQAVFIASMLAERRANALMNRAKAAVRRNEELREERRAILEECRAARRAMRETVGAYARDAKDEGHSASETLHALQTSVGRAAFVMQEMADTGRLARDVERWCAVVFRAA
jgi:hypothetical protein